ncbi:MAG: radical SAM protein [Elusimicrobia bacterium]|nr:radical SAM protein [Elusimicrobiota bacterium]
MVFETTTSCNLRCLHCGTWREAPDPQALSTEEWLRLLRELRRWIGPFQLSFSRGETLLDAGTLAIVREAAGLGVMTTCVSNGTLIDPEMALRLRDSRLGTLVLSIDGMSAATHDYGRGAPGTHAKACEAARAVRGTQGGPAVRVSAIVAGHNLEELEALVRWTAGEGLEGVHFQALQRDGHAWRRLWPRDRTRLDAALDRLVALKRAGSAILNSEAQLEAMRGYFRDPDAPHPELLCNTFTRLSVGARGDVSFCTFKEPIGNVREQGIGAIWGSAAARERFEDILGCKKSCLLLNCNFRPSLRSSAEALWRHMAARAAQARAS